MGRFRDDGHHRGNDRGKFGGRGSAEKEMFQTTCAKCGKDCEVPFKPRGDRPIFCRDCFKKQESRDSGFRNSGSRGDASYSEKRMFEATCDKCGNTCQVPFRPTGEKPVYCADCFGKMGNRTGSSRQEQKSSAPSDVAAQLQSINQKLEQILRVLMPSKKLSVAKEKTVMKATKKTEKSTVAKIAKKKPAKKTVAKIAKKKPAKKK